MARFMLWVAFFLGASGLICMFLSPTFVNGALTSWSQSFYWDIFPKEIVPNAIHAARTIFGLCVFLVLLPAAVAFLKKINYWGEA